MKIACIGNMNNNLFCVTRFLRDKGYDAHLLLLQEFDHFLPETDSYNDDYKAYTTQLDWKHGNHWSKTKQSLAADLVPYDFIIATDISPAFINKAGRRIDIFTPAGSDVFIYPFYKSDHLIPKRSDIYRYAFAWHQRKGVQKARHLSLGTTNEGFEAALDRIRFKGKRLPVACPFIYEPQYRLNGAPDPFKNSTHYEAFREIREGFDFVLFHHSRHEWRLDPESLHYKANDRLIKGFASFLDKRKGSKACLVMLEYGTDYLASQELVRSLGITDHVRWFPMMSRKDLMAGIRICDLGAGEFGHSWFTYGTIYEFMAMGKPVMHYRIDELYKDDYPEFYPMYHAHTTADITQRLLEYGEDPQAFQKTGEDSRQWFHRYAVEKPLEAYEAVIRESDNAGPLN